MHKKIYILTMLFCVGFLQSMDIKKLLNPERLNTKTKIVVPNEKEYPKDFDALAEQIAQQTEITIEEAKDAMRYAGAFPKIKLLPIEDSVARFRDRRHVRLEYQREKMKQLRAKEELNTLDLPRIVCKTNLDASLVEEAFSRYRSSPVGDLPETTERILELTQEYLKGIEAALSHKLRREAKRSRARSAKPYDRPSNAS